MYTSSTVQRAGSAPLQAAKLCCNSVTGSPAVMYTSAAVQLAPTSSSMHASLTSLKLISGWLDDHAKGTHGDRHLAATKVAREAIAPLTDCDSSLNVGSSVAHRFGSRAVMPLPRPEPPCGAAVGGPGATGDGGAGADLPALIRQRPREAVGDVGATRVEDPAHTVGQRSGPAKPHGPRRRLGGRPAGSLPRSTQGRSSRSRTDARARIKVFCTCGGCTRAKGEALGAEARRVVRARACCGADRACSREDCRAD